MSFKTGIAKTHRKKLKSLIQLRLSFKPGIAKTEKRHQRVSSMLKTEDKATKAPYRPHSAWTLQASRGVDPMKIFAYFAALILLIAPSGSPMADHRPGHPPPPGGGGGTTLDDLDCSPDEIAKFDGTDWVCAADESGSGPGWVIYDSDFPPKVVGPSIVGLFDAVVTIEVGGLAGTFQVEPDRFLAQGALMFTTPDCTGQAYSNFNTWDQIAENKFAVIRDESNNSRTVWEQTGPPVIIGISSQFLIDGTCQSFSEEARVVAPVSFTGIDLHQEYPPPYVAVYE